MSTTFFVFRPGRAFGGFQEGAIAFPPTYRYLKGAPADLKDLGHIEFIDLHRGDASYFDVGVNKIVQELENLPAAASIDVSMAEA